VRWPLPAVALAACGIGGLPEPPESREPAFAPSLAHLEHLAMDLTVGGAPVRALAVYADAPSYRPTASPARDGEEGIACVDDAARGAVVWLREHEATGSKEALAEALGLLRFVVAMEQGDGEYLNFVGPDGAPNRTAVSSAKSFSYWAARALWALGEAARVLGPEAAELRPVLDRTAARFGREIAAGRLVGGSVTATSEALLGLLAYQEASPSSERARLIAQAAELLVPRLAGDADRPPWGAHTDGADSDWHGWGPRATEALARASVLLARPDLLAAARAEADGLWIRMLAAGVFPSAITRSGQVTASGQIAYAVGPLVGGFLALADASSDWRYAAMAGLAAGWFLGGNPARAPMYDQGRIYDGVDDDGRINRNSGAESTVEGLLALAAVSRDPVAASFLAFRPVGEATSLATPPERRDFATAAGRRAALVRAGATWTLREEGGPVRLTYWPAANPVEVELARHLIAGWNRTHPRVQVRVQPIPAGRTSEEVLLAAIVARSTPDVCSNISSALLARLVRAHGVVRLDRFPATAARLRERADPAMLAPLRLPDGGVYAFPWKVNPMMVLYNVDLLAAAGVRPPRTHSELGAVTRALARDTDGDGQLDRWAMWMPLKMSWHERFYDFYPLYLAGAGGKTLLEGGKIGFDNDAARAAFRVLRAGFDAGVFPRANFSEGRDPFITGTVAMKMIGPWFLRELERLKVTGLRYDVAPVPVPDGMDPEDAYTFADMKNMVVFSNTAHPAEATELVAFLTSPAADRILIEMTAQLPFRRRVARDPRFAAALRRWPTLPRFADRIEKSRDMDIHPDVVEILDIVSEAYEASSIYGTEDADDALRGAASEARVVIGEE
jgi:multiple sugar transport system substrate-binding protein